jgi:hypothetical protein
VWCVLPMGDAASSNNHNDLSVVPRSMVNHLLDPMARCSHQLNSREHAYDPARSCITGTGKGLAWQDIQAVASEDDESTGDDPRHVDGAYHSELPNGDLWFCSDGQLSVYCKSLVDESIFVYPPSHSQLQPYVRNTPMPYE